MSKSAATIRDIARMLGISKSTVSRALNDHYDVNPETARKVRELAQQIDYQPNLLAQHLKQQRTNTLGVVIPETVNRFFAKAVGGIQQVAGRAGYNVMICQSDESLPTERNNLHTLLASRVDGLLISVSRETDCQDHFEQVIDKGVPLVFFDRIIEKIQASCVYSDNFEIACEGTEHLISQGCRRIAFVVGPQNLYNNSNRLRGYLYALQKNGISVREELIIKATAKIPNLEEYTRYLLNLAERPDAIFANNDMAALEIMHILKKRGIKIPQEIAILGFNNETICRLVEPTLSSIDHPAFDMGAVATEVLLQHISQGDLTPERRLIRSRLVIRESTHKIVR